jgi:primosomal protein N' (replication factor Y) (superfamily II helicase)
MLVHVALPVPLPRTFVYRTNRELTSGTRVRVPFSGRKLIGWVVGEAAAPKDVSRLLDVERVLDDTPSVPAELIELCRWIADYYVTSLGLVLRSALPAALSTPGARMRRRRCGACCGSRANCRPDGPREAFGAPHGSANATRPWSRMGGRAEVAHLTEPARLLRRRLRGTGRARRRGSSEERLNATPSPTSTRARRSRHGSDARTAGRPRGAAGRAPGSERRPFLLYGVTGSGKTLVYIELLREVVLRQGRGAIVLVPEIALTPQTVARFRAEFGDIVAVLHSALSDGERYDAWRALRDGRAASPSARARPSSRPSTDSAPSSSTRSTRPATSSRRRRATTRARSPSSAPPPRGAVCVLGSATPALESWHNAQRGKYRLLELPDRVEGRPLPPVEIIDLRMERALEAASRRCRGQARSSSARRSSTHQRPAAAA